MKGGRGKTSSRFHERLGTSAAEQVGSFKSWIERRVLQMLKGAGLAMGSVAFCNLLVWWTVVGYLLLYWLLIPRPMVFEPVLNFDFDVFQDGPALIHGAKTPFEFPTAQVYFPSHDQQWLWEVVHNEGVHLEDESPDSQNKSEKTSAIFTFPGALGDQLVFGELYDITVHLVLPENAVNNQLGNFMVETELVLYEKTLERHLLARSRRPTSVPYRTWSSTTIFDLLVVPLRFFFGWYMPEHHLSVPALEGWIEETDHRRMPNGVKVTLSEPRLGISRSWIRFAVRLTGIRYYMYYWFWTSFALLTSLAISAQSGLTFSALLAKLIGPSVVKRVRFVRDLPELIKSVRGEGEHEEEDEDEEQDEDEEASEEEEETAAREGEESPIEDEGEDLEEPTGTGPLPHASQSSASAQVLFPSMAGPPRRASDSTVVEVDTDPDKIVVDMPLGIQPTEKPVVEQSAVLGPLPVAARTDVPEQAEQDSPPPANSSTAAEGTERSSRRLSSDFDVVLVDTPSPPQTEAGASSNVVSM